MPPSDNRFALAEAKEQAEATLANGFGQGVLDEDELENRMERLAYADTLLNVEHLVDDLLPVAVKGATVAAGRPSSSAALAALDEVADQHRMVSVLGEQKRAGDWTPARHNEVLTVFGSTTLDLRGARLAPGETEIQVRGFSSEITIIVPPGMAVTAECSTVLANVTQDEHRGEGGRSPVRIRVTGLLVISELSIQIREVGESSGQARRRRRSERKALRKAERQQRRALRRGAE